MILPHGLKFLTKRLKVNTIGKLPAFGNKLDECDGFGGIEIPTKYKQEATDADYLIFIGVVNKPQENWLTYAAACTAGKF